MASDPSPGFFRRWLQRKRRNTLTHFGIPTIVGFGRTTVELARGLARAPGRQAETYEEAVVRLNLDAERLHASYRFHAQIAYWFFACMVVSWTIAGLDLVQGSDLAMLPAVSIGLVFAVLGARGSWSCMRLQQRRLTPFTTWLRGRQFWFPGPYQP